MENLLYKWWYRFSNRMGYFKIYQRDINELKESLENADFDRIALKGLEKKIEILKRKNNG